MLELVPWNEFTRFARKEHFKGSSTYEEAFIEKGGLAQSVERVLKNRVTRGLKPGAGTNTLLVPIVTGDTSRTVWVQVLTPLDHLYSCSVDCCLSGRHCLTPSHRVETISGFIPV